MPIGKLDIALTLDAAGVTAGVKKAQKQLDAFGVALGTMGGQFAHDAIVAAFETITSVITDGIERMEKFNDTAQALGQGLTGGAGLEALHQGLIQLGVDAGEAEDIITTFGENVSKAIAGKVSPATKLFKLLGVSLVDATGQALPLGAVMQDVSNKLAGFAADANKSKAGLILFGDHADELQTILASTGDTITTTAGQFSQAGAEWQAFSQNTEALDKSMQTLQRNIGNVIIPALNDLMQAFIDFGPVITDQFTPLLSDAGTAIGDLITKLGGGSDPFVNFESWIKGFLADLAGLIAGMAQTVRAFTALMATLTGGWNAFALGTQALDALTVGNLDEFNRLGALAGQSWDSAKDSLAEFQHLDATTGQVIASANKDFITAWDARKGAIEGATDATQTFLDTSKPVPGLRLPSLPLEKIVNKGTGGGGAAKVDKEAVALQNYADTLNNAVEPMRVYNAEMALFDAAVAKNLTSIANKTAAQELATKKAEAAAATLGKANTMKDFKEGLKAWGDSVASSLADAIVEGENLEDVFQSLIKALIKMAIEMLVLKPLMNSISTGLGNLPIFGAAGASVGVQSFPTPAPATNALRALPRVGASSGGRSAEAGRSSNVTMGAMTINLGGGAGGDGGSVDSNSARGRAFGTKIRGLVQNEMVKQSRPGGLLWAGPRS